MRFGRAAADAGALVAALALVALVTYLPHLDTFNFPPEEGRPEVVRLLDGYQEWLVARAHEDYQYPLHVDENYHWVLVTSIQRHEGFRYPDPYTAQQADEAPLSLRGLVHERGFHLVLAQVQAMTGLDWLVLFRFGPALWTAFAAGLLWAALRPWPGAPVAAALVALVPTSVRFLGPAFMVPSGVGLAWVAGALVLAPLAARSLRAGLLLLLLAVSGFFIHLITGAAVLLVALCTIPAMPRGDRRGVALLAAVALLPPLWLFQAFQPDLESQVSVLGALPTDLTVFDQLGLAFLVLWALGVALAWVRPPARARLPVQAAALASTVALGFIATNIAFDLRALFLYDRWHQPFALLAAVPVAHAVLTLAAVGAEAAARAVRTRRRGGTLSRFAAPAAAFALTLAVVEGGLAAHIDQPYYHILDDRDWADYTWVAAHADATYEVFLTHPWKAPALTALSGKVPYAWLPPGNPPVRGNDYLDYVGSGGKDPVWLAERNISLVVDPTPPSGADYLPARDRVWVLERSYAEELARVWTAFRE